jgi:hypothetical protein
MPSIVIDLPIPIVPPFPGVPPLPLGGLGGPILQRAIGIGGGLSVGPGGPQLTPPGILATQDNVGVYRLIGQGRWGIFGPGGAAILTVDSVASIEYSKDFAISNYPQQKGGFMSYNKVEQPFMAKVGFLLSRRRATFLGQIGGWLKSLEVGQRSADAAGWLDPAGRCRTAGWRRRRSGRRRRQQSGRRQWRRDHIQHRDDGRAGLCRMAGAAAERVEHRAGEPGGWPGLL